MISSMYDCLTLRVHNILQIFFIVFFFLPLLFYKFFSISPRFLDITVLKVHLIETRVSCGWDLT